MKDEEIIKYLLRVIRLKENENLELLKRLPFEKLLHIEQDRIIMDDVARTFESKKED